MAVRYNAAKLRNTGSMESLDLDLIPWITVTDWTWIQRTEVLHMDGIHTGRGGGSVQINQ